MVNLLEGKTVCVTGDFKPYATREGMEEFLADQGATMVKRVNKATDYLLCAGKPSTKTRDAEKNGVPVIFKDDFITLFGHLFDVSG